jgi:hypothetical protein
MCEIAVALGTEVIGILTPVMRGESERVTHTHPEESINSFCGFRVALLDACVSDVFTIGTKNLLRSLAQEAQR